MRRLMLDQKLKRRKAEDFKNEKDAVKKIIVRENSEDKRYKKYYKLNYHDKKHYDLWLNTDGMTIDYCAEVLRKFIEEKYGFKGTNKEGFIKNLLKFVSFTKFKTPVFNLAYDSSAICSSYVLDSKFLPDNKLTKSDNLPLLN